MEIQINNDFLLRFVSKYQDNAAKAIKYLAVLGVHFLETIHREDLPFKQLQELAKSFSQPKPEPETPFNKELQVIKDELANLNKKIDSRLGSPTSVKQLEGLDKPPTLPKTNEAIQQQPPTGPPKKFAGPGAKFDSKGLTQKPPTAWREGDKRSARSRYAEQLENIEANEQPKSRASPANRSVERRDASNITPKPTEIVLPTVDLKESKNKVTRHHLDDTEAKRIMNEEGVIFFPKAEKEEVPKTVIKPRKEQTLEEVLRKEQPLGESPFFGRERPTQPIEDSFNAEWSDVTESSQNFSQFSKPRFPQARETLATKLFSAANVMQQGQQANKENYRPPQNRQEVRQSREEVRIQPQPDFSKKNQTRPPPNETSKRNSSKNRNSTAQLRQSTSREYGHVSSKIKDEVNYHKELSKQYKKMKQNMSQSEGFSDDFVLSNSTRFDPVREPERPRNLDMDTAAWGRSPYQSEEVGQARTPKLMESDSTLMKSSLTVQQLSAAHPADNRRPVENTRPQQNRFEDFERSEDENMYRSRAENRGGMLDIANSFLNSPLMQHITNEKNYDTSFKDSMGYSIQNRNPSRFQNYASNQDFGESNAYMQSRSGNFGTEEDMKLQSSYGLQQSKYSNAGNNAYNSERVGGRAGHNLKDSTNRRFQENMNNELAASYNKEGVSSLASSNFSNFLNDEMKGFYQKERLDLKKPKNSDLIMRFGSSVTSDSQSFQGAEPTNFSKVEKKSQFYKNEYGDNLDNTNNKTFDGFSFDNANVFKDERMSVTQILNN